MFLNYAAKLTAYGDNTAHLREKRIIMILFYFCVWKTDEKDRCNIQKGEPDKIIFGRKCIKIGIGWGTCKRCEISIIIRREITKWECIPILHVYYTTIDRLKFRRSKWLSLLMLPEHFYQFLIIRWSCFLGKIFIQLLLQFCWFYFKTISNGFCGELSNFKFLDKIWLE